ALIDRIGAEPSPGRRTALVARHSRVIHAHGRIEEAHLYPLCAARMEGNLGALHEACEKHALMRFAADTLLRTRVTDVRFEVRLALVRDLFERHACDEEDWMFPKAKRELTDEQLDALGCDLARAYEEILHPQHRARPVRPVRLRRGGAGAPAAR
ncbi:MAG: hemerythrin domain-containing protein, partial [Polyangiaceae bacterium]|nr:hemerythrin domain-containing protein [Polyangiaceae bacterium]